MHELEKYFKKRVKKIYSLIEEPEDSFNADVFHKLRVEIKKVKALLKLLKKTNKKFELKELFKPYKEIFEKAGRVRELQLEEEFWKKRNIEDVPAQYVNQLRSNRKIARKDFFELLDNNILKKLKKREHEILKAIERTDQPAFEKALIKKEEKITTLLNHKALKFSEAHDLRKRLKEYFFNQKSFHHKLSEEKQTEMKALMDSLGRWHDDRVMASQLEENIKKASLPKHELEQLASTRKLLLIESKEWFSKINQSANALSIEELVITDH